jgi:hypothetical protein
LSLIALSVLAFSTLGIQKNVTGDLSFIKDEGNILADVIAPWFATFYFAAASIKLFSTNLGADIAGTGDGSREIVRGER